MTKKIILFLYFLFFIFSVYQTSQFYSDVNKNQTIIFARFQENFFTTQEIVTNILKSLESQAAYLKTLKSHELLKDQVNENLMSIVLLDPQKNFLAGWSMDIDQHELVHSIDSFKLPLFKKELGWVNINLNSELFTCRGTYVIQRDDLSYLVVTCNLSQAIRAMGSLSFGFSSFSYLEYIGNNRAISPFNFSEPSSFARLLNKKIYIETSVEQNWGFIFSGVWQDLYPYSKSEVNYIFYIFVLWGFVITFGIALWLKVSFKKPHSLWITSFVFDIFCLILIVFLFLDLPETYNQINERTLSFRKAEHLARNEAVLIPTAVYLESLAFPDDSSFVISGFVSQIYPKNSTLEIGFIFPNESILYAPTIEEVSRWETDGSITVLWHFCVGLTNSFSPLFFPFDKRSVHINLWPKEVHTDVVFFPNYLNYHFVAMDGLLSIDSAVDPIGWIINKSTYLLQPSESYSFFGLSHLPLSFDFAILLKRNFLSAFLSNILVLTLCMIVAFLVLFIPNDSSLTSLLATISIFVGLLFIAVTNHAVLRTNLQASSFAYFEYFFISFYVLILALTIDFIFRLGRPIPKYDTTLIRSICYWPIILGSFTLILAFSII